MSVTSPIPDEQGVAYTAFGQPCFYCARSCSDPAVHWHGATGAIYLHPTCVLALFVRLARDVHESECPEHYRQVREGLRLVAERRRSQ
jgi:hypothetical protein